MPIPDVTPNLARGTIRDEIYPTVREWIIAGELAPGEILRDKELAERLGVSRTPVREALQRLKDEGFVQTETNRWTRVAPINVAAVSEIYQIVCALETVAILAAGPHLTREDLEAMTEANGQLRVALANGMGADASDADSRFHDTFVHKCGNSHLIRIMEDLRAKLRRAEIAYFGGAIVAAASADDHEQVIAALRRGAYDEAAAVVRANWDGSLERLMRSQGASGSQTGEDHSAGARQP
jgi:DNA-binding GntR family transcriptional regulator